MSGDHAVSNAMAKRSGGEKVSGPPGQVVPYATQLLLSYLAEVFDFQVQIINYNKETKVRGGVKRRRWSCRPPRGSKT